MTDAATPRRGIRHVQGRQATAGRGARADSPTPGVAGPD